MTHLAGPYLLVALLAWPVLTLMVAAKLAGLRHGPKFKSVAVAAAVLALVWPLALAAVYLLPRIETPR